MRVRPWYSLPLLAVLVLPGEDDVAAPPAQSVVVGLPAEFDAGAQASPYAGPLPARLERPAETFAFPIRLGEVGPVVPLFAGPRRYPFICDTVASGLGPPQVDNRAGVGTPVDATLPGGEIADASPGYSADCLVPTRAWYYYKPRGSTRFARWTSEVPDAAIDEAVVDDRRVPYVLRVEMGTINRFIYLIAALRGERETLDAPQPTRWNGRLIYQFHGGVGIGYRQGKVDVLKLLGERHAELGRGYAIATSTGNATTNHYDIWLAEDTALRVKRQFVALYGAPWATIGIGGSGGAIQQYLLAQNHPGLIDGAIAQYAYPDMITQTRFAFDCELLENYFDNTDAGNPLWQSAERRQWIEGLNADDAHVPEGKARRISVVLRMAFLARGEPQRGADGFTECMVGWRGLTPLVLNPRFAHFGDRVAPDIYAKVRWSYFEDMKWVFGTDAKGYARIPWDNVGVQYGLQALRDGQIDAAQFLRLNARIGSWKPPAQMAPERYWQLNGAPSDLTEFSPWSTHNMALDGDPAPRHRGDPAAIAAAYRSGQVFLGRVEIPIIDVRHYLDPELNMHHAAASFSSRLRMLAAQGHADNQAIWMSVKPDDPTPRALGALEAWLAARRARPDAGWAETRPAAVDDRCDDAQGALIARGPTVWDGDWNGQPVGACQRVYPIYGNPRTVAGDSLHGDRFACALQRVADAIAGGLYAPVDMRPHQRELERVFPDGVCDYRQPDPARPGDLDAPAR